MIVPKNVWTKYTGQIAPLGMNVSLTYVTGTVKDGQNNLTLNIGLNHVFSCSAWA